MNEGWVSIHRKIWGSWIWQINEKFDKRSAWIDLIMLVNHTKGKVVIGTKVLEIERGQHLTSEVKLASRWKWGRKAVNSFLKTLERDEMIRRMPEYKKYTIIEIVNYDNYQNYTTKDASQTENSSGLDANQGTRADTILVQQESNIGAKKEQERSINNNKYKVNNKDNEKNNIILTKEEEEFISILRTVENYPLDREKDVEMFQKLKAKYPTLNILETTKDWAIYKMDKPLKKGDNPRSQLNTSCGNYIKWRKHTKEGELDERGYSFNATNKARTTSNSKKLFSDIII